MQLRNGKNIVYNGNRENITLQICDEISGVIAEASDIQTMLSPSITDETYQSVNSDIDEIYEMFENIEIDEKTKTRNVDEIIKNVTNRLMTKMNHFVDIVNHYKELRFSKEIRSLSREEGKHATLASATHLVEHGEELITVLICWLCEPDILLGLRTYYPNFTITCHIYIIKLIYILDRIREKYEKINSMLSNKTKLVVEKCMGLLQSFGPHILWTNRT